jgi:signal transduction histidine kinase
MDKPGGLAIIVQDNGRGVPDSEKELIFERGFGKHTGLGLFLAREILSLTGITITGNGNGKGARFESRFPGIVPCSGREFRPCIRSAALPSGVFA